MKKYRIVSNVFRNSLKKYDKVSDMAAGLVSYRTLRLFRLASSVIVILMGHTVSNYARDRIPFLLA